jgi:hypothetical protein
MKKTKLSRKLNLNKQTISSLNGITGSAEPPVISLAPSCYLMTCSLCTMEPLQTCTCEPSCGGTCLSDCQTVCTDPYTNC